MNTVAQSNLKTGGKTIDLADTNVLTFNKKEKLIITTVGDLQCNGIEPELHLSAIERTFYIFMYSHKLETYIPFKQSRKLFYGGEVAGDVFVPYFTSINSDKEFNANQAIKGWELHIIND